MKEKIKTQKGFIRIPILIAIITITMSAGVSIVLYKQGKLDSLIASVSQVFEGTENIKPEIKSEELQPEEKQSLLEETNQEENSQIQITQELQQQLEIQRLAEEKKKQEEEREKQQQIEEQRKQEEIQNLAEEKRQREIEEQEKNEREKYESEIYLKVLQETISLTIEEQKLIRDSSIEIISFSDNRIKKLDEQIIRNNDLTNSWSEGWTLDLVNLWNSFYQGDIDSSNERKDIFIEIRNEFQNRINQLSHNLKLINNDVLITKKKYIDWIEAINSFNITYENMKSYLKLVDSEASLIEMQNNHYSDMLIEMEENIQYLKPTSVDSQDFYYIIPPSQDSFLQHYYQQEQIDALNNIANQLSILSRQYIEPISVLPR